MKRINTRNGFTMIELIFVIVVLGILAAVAMPKFVNVQDDAKVSSEKSTIGAIRSAIGMLHGKAIIKNSDFVVKITGATTSPATETVVVAVTDELYPTSLSITSTAADTSKTGVDNTATKSPSKVATVYVAGAKASDGSKAYGTSDGAATLAIVLDLEGRTDWKTGATETSAGGSAAYASGGTYMKQLLEGPASEATGVKDDAAIDEFEVDSDGTWQYDAIVGTIVYRANDGATPAGALTYLSATK